MNNEILMHLISLAVGVYVYVYLRNRWFSPEAQERDRQQQYRNGYEYAAGVLLKTGNDEGQREKLLAEAGFELQNYGDSAFDKGVGDAILDLDKLLCVP